MQKMKNGLMMFCLTVLLSCTALMMNTPTASAMTLNDLQGDYRIVYTKGEDGIFGTIVSLRMEDGNLIGRVKQKSSGAENWVNGGIFMRNVYVENGKIYCRAIHRYDDLFFDMEVEIYSNGAKLCFVEHMNTIHELKRL